ncbi:MAG TPA: molybdate ABC transporter substrate-binding protein [Puia sp.]|nr:molybdate ABC transporter substrate-binding protein [Puia sp.]
MRTAIGQLFLTMLFPLLSPTGGQSSGLPAGQRTTVTVAAAADLKFAMDSLAADFGKKNPGIDIKLIYGSSGNFFQQIGNGAPFDLFFSADMDYPRQLQARGLTASVIRIYGTGQLVLWSRSFDPDIRKMDGLLDASVKKIAIANPAHAPYGRRAEEALRYFKLYDRVRDKLVLGENIAQTAQYAQSGAADVAIIALSLAVSPAMQRSGGKYWLIPPASHQTIEQGFVLLPHGKGNNGADRFMQYLSTPEAGAILKSFGFGRT